MEKKSTPSSQKQQIIQHIIAGDHAIANACAGSGKNTTVLSLASELSTKLMIRLTFNTGLRQDIKNKTEEYNLTNLHVHTFHSLAVKYYLPTAHNDIGIRRIINENLLPQIPLPFYQIFILDEAQGMNDIYFQWVVKFIQDMNPNPPIQLVVLGDYRQSLYEFKGSNTCYLTMAEQIWTPFRHLVKRPFHHCSLTMSFRITNPIASFINEVIIEEYESPIIHACRDGSNVSFLSHTSTGILNHVIHTITELIQNGISPSDIFILSAS